MKKFYSPVLDPKNSKIKASKTSIAAILLHAFFTLCLILGVNGNLSGQTVYTIGTGVTTTYQVPINNFYGYSYNQSIYPAANLTAQGMTAGMQITQIAWYINAANAAGTTNNNNWTIFLGNTAQAAFATTTNWVATAAMTQVYSGNVNTWPTGWVTVTLQTPFTWTGGNLVVACDENNASYTYVSTMYRYTAGAANSSIIYYSDFTNPNPSAPPTATTRNTYLPNIQLTAASNTACAGTPTGGTTVSTLTTVCPGTNFTLSTTGSAVGTGLTYQWQSSPNNVTWTNITGATAATLVTNTSTATYYRRIITCANSGISSNSTSLYISINGGGPCACLTYPSSSATSAADDEILNVTFGSLSNSSSCGVAAPGPGSAASMYSNYAGYLTAPNMYQGTSYPLSVTGGMCSGTSYSGVVTVYIDYNANGVFTDAGELVYTSPYTSFAVGGSTVSTTVNIPMTAAVGTVRMRVIEVESTVGAASTGTYTWGETEDYCINILAPPPCSGTPAPGNTLTSSSAVGSGQTVNLSLQNNTIGTGVTYQWQTASSSTGPWTNVAGQTNSTYTATITALSYFQCIVTCTGNTTISNPVLVSVIACIPAGSTTYYLTNVNTVGASTNFTNVTGASAGGYGNYYSTIGASAYQGSSFTINMNSIYSSDYFQLWIDWNNDLDFADAGESVYNSNAYVASGSTVVNVAGAQAVGTYRMRVSNGYLGATTACGPNSWGEFEDYSLTVLAVPLPTITSIPASGCPAVSVTITGTGLNTVSAVQFGGVNASSFTIVNSTTINAIPGTGASGPITVSNMTGTATSSTSFSLGSQPATPIITASQSQFCGTGGTVTLNASGSSGTYTWTSLEGAPSLSGTTGTSITAGITQTSAVQVQTLNNGCYSLPAIQSIGLYPLPTANLTTSANGVCPGTSATINTGLSAGNFTAACTNLTPYTIPSGAAYLCNNGAQVAGLASGSLDDGGWSAIPLGFSYNFFGTTYTTINVGTNGVLQFGAYNATALGDFIIGALPNTVDPLGAIYAGSNDLHCGYVGSNTYIRYWTNGYAPNRRFIVEYYVNQYAYSTTYHKFQVILYETTGLVGIIGRQTQSTNAKSIGVNSPSGTIGAAAPNCAVTPNTVNYWSGTTAQISASAPQSWIFTPPTNYTSVWTGNGSALPSPAVSSGTNIFTQNVTPAVTTLYNISYINQTTGCTNAPGSAQVTMTILDNIAPSGVNAQASVSGVCSGTNFTLSFSNPPSPDGLSYQWQVSTNNGATWANILGATAATASVNQTVTSLYRCMFNKCSGTPSYSSTVTVLTNGAVWQSTFVSMNTGAANWCVGEVRTVSITLTNTGTATWTNAAPDINVGIKWNGDLDYFIRVDANGLVSGATQTYYLTVTAPSTAGTNNLSFDLVNETNFWFANNTSCGFPSGVVSTSSLITINNYPTVNAGADVSTCPGGPITLTGTSTLPAVVGPLSASGSMYDNSGTPVNLTLSGAPTGATITSITFTPILAYAGTNCSYYNSWYLMQYWNGSAWVNITTCNTPITITNFNGNIVNGQILSIRPQDLDAVSDFVTLTLSNVVVSYQPGGTSPVTWSSSPTGYSSTTPTSVVTPMTTTTYTLTGNNNGCTASDQVIVTVVDIIAPTITAPTAVTVNANVGLCAATGVNIGTPITNDNCSVASVTNNGPTSYPLGNSTVTWLVTDGSGNTATATQVVTVIDNQNPTITAPSAVTVNNNLNLCTASGVALGTPVYNDNCSVASVVNNAPAIYPLGNTTVTWTITDGSGNTATATQTVTVVDNTNPTIVAPANITTNATATCGVTGLTLGTPITADNCSVATVVNNAPSTFNLGNTTVTWTVTDGSGLTATATQVITVVDNTLPTITAPSSVTVNANAGTCVATSVAIGTPVTNDNCSVASVTNNGLSTYPLGNTTVTWIVTDGSGNTATATQTITVIDNQNPTITPPSAVTVNSDLNICTASGVALGSPIYNDNCSVASLNNNAPAVFPLGNTTVTWTVTDGSGLSTSATQIVTVLDTQNPVAHCHDTLFLLNALGSFTATGAMVNNASVDNCGIASYTLNQSTFTCADIGTHPFTMTVTDVSGNTNSCISMITVQDIVPPVAICQNFTAQLNSSGVASITAAQINNGSNDACGIAATSINQSNFNCANLGANTVTLTVTDLSGNVSTCTSVLTIADTISPLFLTTPASITNTAVTSICGRVINYTLPTFGDNCTANMSQIDNSGLTSGGIFPVGVTTQTYEIVDQSGNNTLYSFTITIVDNQNPIITNCPANISVGTSQNSCTAVVNWTAPAISDNCPGVQYTVSNTSGSTFPTGTTTVSYIATDVSNNTSTCSFTVNVTDNVAPVVPTLATVTGSCSVTVTPPTTTDNCSGVITGTASTPLSYSIPGTNVITWTFTDIAGNSSTANQTVIVQDNVFPTITAPATVSTTTNTACSATGVLLGTPVTADDCSVASVTNNAPATFNLGTTTITWTVTDASGNATNATQLVTVIDNVNPTITAPAAVNVNANNACSAFSVALGTPVTSDNCSVTSVTHNAPATFAIGATTVTWTVTDGSGLTATATQTVTVVDATNPTIVAPANITANASATCSVTGLNLGTPVAADNCSVASVTHNAPVTFNTGTTTVTWTVTDASGNTATAAQTVTIIDNTFPNITAPASISTTTNTACTATGVVLGTPVTADNCSVASVTNNAPVTFNLGTTTVTWTVTDASGNAANATQLVTVIDNVNPTITAPVAVTVNANNACSAFSVALGTPVTSDNCSVTSVTHNAPATFAIGATTVTWTVTDGSGLTATATQTVTVVDATNPTIVAPANITANASATCSVTGLNLGTPVAADNCSVASVTHNAPVTFNIGNTTVTWTVTDASGNTATATQTVTIIDNTFPTITAPAAINTTTNTACTATGVVLGTPVTVDNCSVASVTNNAPAAFNLGTTTVTWTVTDASGNAANATQLVTVIDNVNPTITAPAAVNATTNNGCMALNLALGAPVTADNCSIASVTHNAPNAFNVGITVVTWTITDGSGNTATTTQNVTITDVIAPIVIAPQNINSSSNTSCTATGLNIGTAIAFDNCTVASITSNAPASFPVGTTIVIWSATDNSGNIGTASQTVTIIDNINPTIIPPVDLTAVTNSGCTADNLNLGTPITSDNCGVAFVTNNAPSAFAVGETFVTWTVIDVNGNSTNTIQKVTITDDVAPILIPAANITVFANNSCNAYNVNLGNPVASDNCGITSLVNDGPTVYEIGTTTVNWTVTDNNGNVVTASQTVTVIDNQIPTIITPASMMLSTNNACVASNVVIGNAITNDNCTVASVVNDAPVDFPIGTTVVTWTVTDASGNTNTGTQTITVSDDINPTPVLQNITVTLDTQGNAVVGFNDVDAGSFDNCGIATTSLSQTNFDCGNIGQNVLTVTITDNNGNTSTTNITLTIQTNGIDSDLDGIDDSCDDVADPIELLIPEAFTPNGNNINDLFVIRNIETLNTKNLEVFNRYGNRVYSSSNYQNDWDGSRSDNGQALPDGTYYYVFVTDNDTFKGYVYINRVKQ